LLENASDALWGEEFQGLGMKGWGEDKNFYLSTKYRFLRAKGTGVL
jgi:hypothetical protein